MSAALPAAAQDWPQWGQDAGHDGAVSRRGQPAGRILAQAVFDPFTPAELADPLAGDGLALHYQTPLVDGDDVFLLLKSGAYTGLAAYQTEIWNEQRLHWEHGELVRKWVFRSDWKPVPLGDGQRGPAWEPVFHPALAGSFVYVPGLGGSVYKLDRESGAVVGHVKPFGAAIDPDVFLTGPITADARGNVYFDTVRLDHDNPWNADVAGSWLVKVTPAGTVLKVSYAELTPGAPAGAAQCPGSFGFAQLPWPPGPEEVAPTTLCGSQRAAINSAPAVAPDGVIYVGSVAHLSFRTAYLVAVNPDLTPRWLASLRELFHDGCGVLLPPNGAPGGCRAGARRGVDPSENRPGSGQIIPDSTASPVVAPDGSILLGTASRYNYAQGHLLRFSARGELLAAYPFGWDDTPAIFAHDGTFSVVTKDNHYGGLGSYCDDPVFCPPDRTGTNPAYPEAYLITQLSSALTPEWSYRNTNTESCTRHPDGTVTCVSNQPAGFEWCVNAPAVDRDGVVYAGSEDGNLYAIDQGGRLRDNLFLQLAVGAAYTPVAIGGDGKLYAENFGTLFVAGR